MIDSIQPAAQAAHHTHASTGATKLGKRPVDAVDGTPPTSVSKKTKSEGIENIPLLERINLYLNDSSILTTATEEKELILDCLNNLSKSTLVRAFWETYSKDEGVVIRVLHDMNDLKETLLPLRRVDCSDKNNHTQHIEPIERLIVLFSGQDISYKEQSRLNRNDTHTAQLNNHPLTDPDIGAKYLELVPLHTKTRKFPKGNVSDILRREADLIQDLYIKLKHRDAFIPFLATIHSIETTKTTHNVDIKPQTQHVVIDMGFKASQGLTQNTYSINEQGKIKFLENKMNRILEHAKPGELIHLTFLNSLEADKKNIKNQISQLIEQKYLHQTIQRMDKPTSSTLVLPDGVKLAVSFKTDLKSYPHHAVCTGLPELCDTCLNDENFRSHIDTLGLTKPSHPQTKQRLRLSTTLGTSIYIASNLNKDHWHQLWAALEGTETIVLNPDIDTDMLPEFIEKNLFTGKAKEKSFDSTSQGTKKASSKISQPANKPYPIYGHHRPYISGTTQAKLAYDALSMISESSRAITLDSKSDSQKSTASKRGSSIAGSFNGASKESVTIESIITPNTSWDDLLHKLTKDSDISTGLLGSSTPTPLTSEILSQKPVHWTLHGMNPHIKAHLSGLLCENPYIMYMGEKTYVPNLTITIVEDGDDKSILKHKLLQKILVNEGFSLSQVPLERCKTLYGIHKFLLKHTTSKEQGLFANLKRLVKQIKTRYQFEIASFYKPTPDAPLSNRLLHTAMRQAHLLDIKHIDPLYKKLMRKLKGSFSIPTVNSDEKNQLKAFDAYVSTHSNLIFDSEKEWLGCRTFILEQNRGKKIKHPKFLAIYQDFKKENEWDQLIREQSSRVQKGEDQLKETIRNHPITVLLGAPGEGKTYSAKKIGNELAHEINKKCYVVSCHIGQTEDNLFNHPSVQSWKTNGGVLVLDEGTMAPQAVKGFESLINSLRETLQNTQSPTLQPAQSNRIIITGNNAGMAGRSTVIGKAVAWNKVSKYKHVYVHKMLNNLFKTIPKDTHQFVHDLWEKLTSCPTTFNEQRAINIRDIGSILWRAYRHLNESFKTNTIDAASAKETFKYCCLVATHELFASTMDLNALSTLKKTINMGQILPIVEKPVENFFNQLQKKLLAQPKPMYLSSQYMPMVREIFYCATNKQVAHQYKKQLPFQKGLFISGRPGSGKDIGTRAVLQELKAKFIELKDVDLDNFESIIEDFNSSDDAVIVAPDMNRLEQGIIEIFNDKFEKRPIIATVNPSDEFEERGSASEALVSRVVIHDLKKRSNKDLMQLGTLILNTNQKEPSTNPMLDRKKDETLIQQLIFFHRELDELSVKTFGHSMLSDKFFIDAATQLATGETFQAVFKYQYFYYLSLLGTSINSTFNTLNKSYQLWVDDQKIKLQSKQEPTAVRYTNEEEPDTSTADNFSENLTDLAETKTNPNRKFRLPFSFNMFGPRSRKSTREPLATRLATKTTRPKGFIKRHKLLLGGLAATSFALTGLGYYNRNLLFGSSAQQNNEPNTFTPDNPRNTFNLINPGDPNNINIPNLATCPNPEFNPFQAWETPAQSWQTVAPLQETQTKTWEPTQSWQTVAPLQETQTKTWETNTQAQDKAGTWTQAWSYSSEFFTETWKAFRNIDYSQAWEAMTTFTDQEDTTAISYAETQDIQLDPNELVDQPYHTKKMNFQLDAGNDEIYVPQFFDNPQVDDSMIAFKEYKVFGQTLQPQPYANINFITPQERPLETHEVEINGIYPNAKLSRHKAFLLPAIGTEELLDVTLPHNFNELRVKKMGNRHGILLAPNSVQSKIKTQINWKIAAKKDELTETPDHVIKKELFKLNHPFRLSPEAFTAKHPLPFKANPEHILELRNYLEKATTVGEAIWQLILFFRRNTLHKKPDFDETATLSGWEDLPCRYRALGFGDVMQMLSLARKSGMAFNAAYVENGHHAFYHITIPGSKLSPEKKLLKVNLGGGFGGRQVDVKSIRIGQANWPSISQITDDIVSLIHPHHLLNVLPKLKINATTVVGAQVAMVILLYAYYKLAFSCALSKNKRVPFLPFTKTCDRFAMWQQYKQLKRDMLENRANYAYGDTLNHHLESLRSPIKNGIVHTLINKHKNYSSIIPFLPLDFIYKVSRTKNFDFISLLQTEPDSTIENIIRVFAAVVSHRTQNENLEADEIEFKQLSSLLVALSKRIDKIIAKHLADPSLDKQFISTLKKFMTGCENIKLYSNIPSFLKLAEQLLISNMPDTMFMRRVMEPNTTLPWSKNFKLALHQNYFHQFQKQLRKPLPHNYPLSLCRNTLGSAFNSNGKGHLDPVRLLSGLPAIERLGKNNVPIVLVHSSFSYSREVPMAVRENMPHVNANVREELLLLREVFPESMTLEELYEKYPIEFYEDLDEGTSLLTTDPFIEETLGKDKKNPGKELKSILKSIFKPQFHDIVEMLIENFVTLNAYLTDVDDTKSLASKSHPQYRRSQFRNVRRSMINKLEAEAPFEQYKDDWFRLIEAIAIFWPTTTCYVTKHMLSLMPDEDLFTSKKIKQIIKGMHSSNTKSLQSKHVILGIFYRYKNCAPKAWYKKEWGQFLNQNLKLHKYTQAAIFKKAKQLF